MLTFLIATDFLTHSNVFYLNQNGRFRPHERLGLYVLHMCQKSSIANVIFASQYQQPISTFRQKENLLAFLKCNFTSTFDQSTHFCR